MHTLISVVDEIRGVVVFPAAAAPPAASLRASSHTHPTAMSTESVKVAVRVRPFNGREKDRNATCIIRMNGAKTTIINPDSEEEKDFAFDYSYWSHDGFDVLQSPEADLGLPGDGYNAPTNRRGGPTTSQYGSEYSSQKHVFEGLGLGVLDNALQGFNCCLFAYGQTGSGKSYSFVGYGANKGIVPQVRATSSVMCARASAHVHGARARCGIRTGHPQQSALPGARRHGHGRRRDELGRRGARRRRRAGRRRRRGRRRPGQHARL